MKLTFDNFNRSSRGTVVTSFRFGEIWYVVNMRNKYGKHSIVLVSADYGARFHGREVVIGMMLFWSGFNPKIRKAVRRVVR